jgi:hypothetical protein
MWVPTPEGQWYMYVALHLAHPIDLKVYPARYRARHVLELKLLQ